MKRFAVVCLAFFASFVYALDVTQTGSAESVIQTQTEDSSSSITVPSDAEIIVVAVSGYNGDNSNFFDALNIDGGGLDFTEVVDSVYSGSSTQVEVWVLTDQDSGWGTGSKTLTWSTVGTIGEGLQIGVWYYKNIDDSTPTGDTDERTAGGNWTSSLSPAPGSDDMAVVVSYSYNTDCDSAPSGEGQTSLYSQSAYNSAGFCAGHELNESGIKVEHSWATELVPVAFVINGGTAGEGPGVDIGLLRRRGR